MLHLRKDVLIAQINEIFCCLSIYKILSSLHTYTKIRSKIYIGAARKTQCDASIASVLSHSLELWGFLVLNSEDLLISAHIENKSNS